VSDLFQKRRAQLAAKVGLTEHQWSVLEEVSTEHFMPSLFARQRESSAAAVSKTIRQLVERGLVSVSLQREDARQRRYDLTVEGRRVIEQLRSSRQRAISTVWGAVPESQLQEFVRFGQELGDRLELLVAEERHHNTSGE
jgi:DNA-binding MarR family transcriptional regulator